MSQLTRRRFLRTTAATSAAFSLFTISGTRASGQVIGANGSVRVAVAGINGRGKSHIEEFAKQENVQVNCLIDPDSRLFKPNSKKLSDKYNTDPIVLRLVTAHQSRLGAEHINTGQIRCHILWSEHGPGHGL